MTMRFLDWRIFTVTNKTSIALTTGRGRTNLVLLHRCTTFWTGHHAVILPKPTHHFSHSSCRSYLTLPLGFKERMNKVATLEAATLALRHLIVS
jgi:hypothetical protein